MQQRQLRLGDILDDYCPRERRLTNHAVVAMVGDEVKQTRCTTCDAEHEFKHAKVPRQRRKSDTSAALQPPVVAGAGPKRVVALGSKVEPDDGVTPDMPDMPVMAQPVSQPAVAEPTLFDEPEAVDLPLEEDDDVTDVSDGPAHRRLIRATLPRQEGQQPPARPAPDFTIRQPAAGRPNRFRPRHQRGGQVFQGNRSNSQGPTLNGMPRQGNSRSPVASRPVKRHDPGRKRSK